MFLFSELLVLTRPVTRNERSCFQVYRQPIPVRDLSLEDLQDGEIRMGGSFRGAFTNGEKGRLSCSPNPFSRGHYSPMPNLLWCSLSTAKKVMFWRRLIQIGVSFALVEFLCSPSAHLSAALHNNLALLSETTKRSLTCQVRHL